MRELSVVLFLILVSCFAIIGGLQVTLKLYDHIHPIQEQGIPIEEVEFYHKYHGIGMRVDGTCMSSWQDGTGWWFTNEIGKKCEVKTEVAIKAYEWHKKTKDFEWNLRIEQNESSKSRVLQSIH